MEAYGFMFANGAGSITATCTIGSTEADVDFTLS